MKDLNQEIGKISSLFQEIMTDQPTEQKTDMRAHREVQLAIM